MGTRSSHCRYVRDHAKKAPASRAGAFRYFILSSVGDDPGTPVAGHTRRTSRQEHLQLRWSEQLLGVRQRVAPVLDFAHLDRNPAPVGSSFCPEKAQIDWAWPKLSIGVGFGFGPPVNSPAKAEPPTLNPVRTIVAAATIFFTCM